jgi:hypothetical protein
MFIRADKLISSNVADHSGRQVIHFGWEEYRPSLLYYDRYQDKELPFRVERIDWDISESKRCVGRFDDGIYKCCPDNMPVNKFDQCSKCASVWIKHQDCIFEPRCNGELCDSAICRKSHTVYVAFFGEGAKIGMTTSARLIGRGIEQGADAIAPLARLQGRKEGREAEKDIADMLRLTQFTPRKKAVKLLHFSSSKVRLDEIFQAYRETLAQRMTPLDEPLQHLDQYPLKGMEVGRAELVTTAGRHKGDVLGFKGKFLVYRTNKDEIHALEASDLPGRIISTTTK